MKPITLTVATLCLTTSLAGHAATERDLDSHVHGGATMNMATGDNELIIEFDSPWVNLVGFEHEPSTDEQRESIAQSVTRLQQGSALFVFSGTQCNMVDVAIANSMSEKHDEHSDGESGAEHSAIIVSYVFNCTELQKLETVRVEFFSLWSGIDDIDVQLAGPKGQSAMELDPANRQIDMTPVL